MDGEIGQRDRALGVLLPFGVNDAPEVAFLVLLTPPRYDGHPLAHEMLREEFFHLGRVLAVGVLLGLLRPELSVQSLLGALLLFRVFNLLSSL